AGPGQAVARQGPASSGTRWECCGKPAGGTVMWYKSSGEEAMSITASEARRNLFPLIEREDEDRSSVEIVSRRGNAVLMAADEYAALAETAYLLRSPANARRLHTAYTDAVEGRNLAERTLADLEEAADRA